MVRSQKITPHLKSYVTIMKKLIFTIILMTSIQAFAESNYTLEQLQGAWWADFSDPTAYFAIHDHEVWLDYDHTYEDVGYNDFAQLQYSLNGTSGPWYAIRTYDDMDYIGQHEHINVSSYVAGHSNVVFRFYYDDDDEWAWWWKVDDVVLTAR